ncbi:hypothetical protein D7319_30770 [Streptomyces radicis]|uniref:Uncharacterized protein n=1 Tax=Streptomyces radicis TaxID=1750517 RepID=A0A3A9VUD2_9ACTN|nr:hypothetical protein D7319_30770 [Streptomyces radicis]RKN13846.1 hypothetical protein D7318_30320 [Streptomyces radicis]
MDSPRRDAERALFELKAALEVHGIALPILRIHECVPDAPLVELGRIRPETARALTRVLTGGGRVRR